MCRVRCISSRLGFLFTAAISGLGHEAAAASLWTRAKRCVPGYARAEAKAEVKRKVTEYSVDLLKDRRAEAAENRVRSETGLPIWSEAEISHQNECGYLELVIGGNRYSATQPVKADDAVKAAKIQDLLHRRHPTLFAKVLGFVRSEDGAFLQILSEHFEWTLATLVKNVLGNMEHEEAKELSRSIAKRLNDAVKVMHQSGMYHRDLMPNHIFFDHQHNLKIGHFARANNKDTIVPKPGPAGLHRRSSDGEFGTWRRWREKGDDDMNFKTDKIRYSHTADKYCLGKIVEWLGDLTYSRGLSHEGKVLKETALLHDEWPREAPRDKKCAFSTGEDRKDDAGSEQSTGLPPSPATLSEFSASDISESSECSVPDEGPAAQRLPEERRRYLAPRR